ncbi:uncharacterized protein YALI1_D12376g [Yarrowia lipolytica]|uniref:Uncharacterized protein n=1 Tax=Yarrowia lipolytica TaxID=4952 RepID=A0A1D8NDY8_YARLL|nr:hypothetical protein YALI1_D12376g [Yarrowia lipolytica]
MGVTGPTSRTCRFRTSQVDTNPRGVLVWFSVGLITTFSISSLYSRLFPCLVKIGKHESDLRIRTPYQKYDDPIRPSAACLRNQVDSLSDKNARLYRPEDHGPLSFKAQQIQGLIGPDLDSTLMDIDDVQRDEIPFCVSLAERAQTLITSQAALGRGC